MIDSPVIKAEILQSMTEQQDNAEADQENTQDAASAPDFTALFDNPDEETINEIFFEDIQSTLTHAIEIVDARLTEIQESNANPNSVKRSRPS